MDHNPYTPPKAVVGDAAMARGKRPLSVNVALLLLAVGLARQTWELLVQLQAARTGEQSMFALVALIVRLGLFGWLWANIARGRNWARHTTLALVLFSASLFILRSAFMARLVPEGVTYRADPAALSAHLLPHLCALMALYLLYFPGRHWFRSADA